MNKNGWGRSLAAGVVIGLILSFIVAVASFTYSTAAPLPPRRVVNHQARQCAEIIPGDECGDVVLPQGWEYLDAECPQDYAIVELRPDWTPFKASFCCTEGHSGVPGDCDDVVVNPQTRQCAFVDDIQGCPQLPRGWQAWGKDCPTGSDWIDDIDCPVDSGKQIPTAALLPTADSSAASLSTITPFPTRIAPTQTTIAPGSLFPTPICGSLGIVLALIAVLFSRRFP